MFADISWRVETLRMFFKKGMPRKRDTGSLESLFPFLQHPQIDYLEVLESQWVVHVVATDGKIFLHSLRLFL